MRASPIQMRPAIHQKKGVPRRSPNVHPRKRPLHEHSRSYCLQEVSGETEKPSKACTRSSHLVGRTGEDRQLAAGWAASGRGGRANGRCTSRDGHCRVAIDRVADCRCSRRATDGCNGYNARRGGDWHDRRSGAGLRHGRYWNRSRSRDDWGNGAGLGDGHWGGLGNDRRSWTGGCAVDLLATVIFTAALVCSGGTRWDSTRQGRSRPDG